MIIKMMMMIIIMIIIISMSVCNFEKLISGPDADLVVSLYSFHI